MSVTTALAALQAAHTDISAAITSKGGTVNTGDGFSDFATGIGTISVPSNYGLITFSAAVPSAAEIKVS